jgi:hypothetical protein
MKILDFTAYGNIASELHIIHANLVGVAGYNRVYMDLPDNIMDAYLWRFFSI